MSAVGLAVIAAAWPSAAAEPKLLTRIDDPRYDDRGTGEYVYPSAEWYKRGQFDIRALEVLMKDGIVTFRVTIDHPFQRPNHVMTAQNQALSLENGIYFQNIDIYIDHTAEQGETQGIPGRNIRFYRHEGWDTAVVLTPQPDLVRATISDWPPISKTLVPAFVRSYGRQVWVEVPELALGAKLGPNTGYQVAISGALFQNNFELVRWATDRLIKNAFTMPIFSVPEQMAFGGGVLSRWQPRTIDILTPPQQKQAEILRRFVHDTATVAVVPMVYPDGPGRLAKSSTVAESSDLPSLGGLPVDEVRDDGTVVATIRDLHEQLAILKRPSADIPLYRIGAVIGEDGSVIGRVVVTAVFAEFIQATVVEGQGKVRRGLEVRFDSPRRSKGR